MMAIRREIVDIEALRREMMTTTVKNEALREDLRLEIKAQM